MELSLWALVRTHHTQTVRRRSSTSWSASVSWFHNLTETTGNVIVQTALFHFVEHMVPLWTLTDYQGPFSSFSNNWQYKRIISDGIAWSFFFPTGRSRPVTGMKSKEGIFLNIFNDLSNSSRFKTMKTMTYKHFEGFVGTLINFSLLICCNCGAGLGLKIHSKTLKRNYTNLSGFLSLFVASCDAVS